MESYKNTYKLEQSGKVYILTTSVVGENIRLTCKNSSSSKNKKYSRDFTVEQLHKLDKLFHVLKTPLQSIEYIDKALKQQKVGITEENNGIKISFYITTKGITNQIDIPLGEVIRSSTNSNGSHYLQQNEKIENYDTFDTNNYQQYFQNSEYNQETPIIDNNNFESYAEYPATSNIPSQVETNTNINTNDNANIYNTDQNNAQKNINEFDYNQYFSDIKTTTETGPYITPSDNPDTNQYFQNYQIEENTNTNTNTNITTNTDENTLTNNEFNQYISEYTEQNTNNDINLDEQIKQILEQSNNANSNNNIDINNININDMETNVITTQAEEKEINKETKPLTTTKVLPVKTTTKILPPLGPFTNLEGLDLHKLGMMNSEHQKMPPFAHMFQNEISIPQTETKNNYYEINNQIITQPETITTGTVKTKTTKTTITTNTNLNNDYNINANENLYFTDNLNINNTQSTPQKEQINQSQNQLINDIKSENVSLKQQIKELRKSQKELQNASITKSQLSELESLRKKLAEFEILKGQLKELNSLRIEVAEYHLAKGQLKEVSQLKEKINSQNKEIAELKLKAAEADKLRLRVEELENINRQYEQDIKGLKESLRIYSIKTDVKEDKEIVEEETPEEITVKGDIIHDISELELISKKISHDGQKLTLNLLYKATADTDKAAAFHAKCDEAKSSIVLVETKKGKRFGGFTSCSWSGDCIEKKDEKAFVFSFDKMKTYDNIPGEEAIGCYPKFGPVFLGCQIRIYDNAFTQGGTTFERGLNFDTEEDYELNAGERVFDVKEIEVYEVVFE